MNCKQTFPREQFIDLFLHRADTLQADAWVDGGDNRAQPLDRLARIAGSTNVDEPDGELGCK